MRTKNGGDQPFVADAPGGAEGSDDRNDAAAGARPWKIAIVDDDASVHAVTRLVLSGLRFKGRPIRMSRLKSRERR